GKVTKVGGADNLASAPIAVPRWTVENGVAFLLHAGATILQPLRTPAKRQLAFSRQSGRSASESVGGGPLNPAGVGGSQHRAWPCHLPRKSASRTVLYLPGERVDNLSWSPDGSRLMFDRTQMIGFYPIR